MPTSTKEAKKLFHDGCLALSKIEANGVRVDETYLENAIKKTKDEIVLKKRELENGEVFKMWRSRFGDKANLGSKVQLGKVVFNDLGFTCKILTESKRPKVDETVLAELDHPFLQDYLYFEKLKKAKTNLEIIRRETVDGFVHPAYNLNIPTSFRSGCQLPNWQNQYVRNPKLGELVRRCFIPRPGHVMAGLDYAGIEVKMSACVHGDPVLIEYIKDETKDMHRDMAAQCYMLKTEEVNKKSRYCAKNMFVFPEFYGSYYIACAKALWEAITKMNLKIGETNKSIKKRLKKKGITRLGACDPEKKPVPGTFEHHIQKVENDFWNRRFKVYNDWKKTTWEEYQRRGWVKLLTGFVIKGLFEKNQILNFPIQSIAFHCDLQSVIWFQKWLEKKKMKSLIIGEVHDSIDGDVHEDELDDYLGMAQEIMTQWIPKKWTWINVPLSVEAEVASPTRSIFDKKPYKFSEN